jgi:hypothetical protein
LIKVFMPRLSLISSEILEYVGIFRLKMTFTKLVLTQYVAIIRVGYVAAPLIVTSRTVNVSAYLQVITLDNFKPCTLRLI